MNCRWITGRKLMRLWLSKKGHLCWKSCRVLQHEHGPAGRAVIWVAQWRAKQPRPGGSSSRRGRNTHQPELTLPVRVLQWSPAAPV